MCGRYAITLPPEAVREWFRTFGEIPNWPVYYNAAPTTALPVVRSKEGQRVLMLMQ
jgi:putative SOS response-associated peptidase YedK